MGYIKMTKITLTILIAFLLVGTVFAVGELLLNKEISIPEKKIGINGTLTFEVNKNIYSCYINEPDGIIDDGDIINCALTNYSIDVKGQKLTNIKDWNDKVLVNDGSWVKK